MLQWLAGEGGEMQTWDGQAEDKDVMKALLEYIRTMKNNWAYAYNSC